MSVDSALLFWAITAGYLSTDVILFCLLYRMDRQHQQLQQEIAATQQQASVIQDSVSYLENLARTARGDTKMVKQNDAGASAEC